MMSKHEKLLFIIFVCFSSSLAQSPGNNISILCEGYGPDFAVVMPFSKRYVPLNKIVTANCKSNCRQIRLICSHSDGFLFGTWNYAYYEENIHCTDEPPFTLIRESDQLIGRLEIDGRYTFWCGPGRTLFPRNPGTVNCRQGIISGDIPFCQVAGTETHPIEMTIEEQLEFKVMTQNATNNESTWKNSVIVPALGAVSAVLFLALIGCGVCMWRMRCNKMDDNKSPAPNPVVHEDPRPIRIVAALAPSPSEPGYLEVFVAQVIQDSPTDPQDSGSHEEGERESPDDHQVQIPVHPGEPGSPYDDVLNLENNKIVGEYEYIRYNGKKL